MLAPPNTGAALRLQPYCPARPARRPRQPARAAQDFDAAQLYAPAAPVVVPAGTIRAPPAPAAPPARPANGAGNGAGNAVAALAAVPLAQQVAQFKLDLAARAAGCGRGALAGPLQRLEVEALVGRLEGLQQGPQRPAPLLGSPAPVEGRWELLYASCEPFRSSPFFWAFQEGLLGGNRGLAGRIFAFTDGLPGATVGRAFQTIDLAAGSLLSEVDLEVWPGARGTVVTAARLAPARASPADELDVSIESTRVAGSNVAGALLDRVAVPVERVFQTLRGPGAARVRVRTTYVDADLRIARTQPDGQVFVYRRA